ncbi:heavy metal transport/detoxification protein, partial [Clostridium botulinum]|nr:heavy metal transport/detoxification protein [Clostridium botulinum]
NLQEKCATVETSESNEILKEAIEDAGYDVVEIK